MSRRVLLASLAALTLLLAGATSADENCVVGPDAIQLGLDQAAAQKGSVPLAVGQWVGDVFVLPYTFGSTYDADVGGVNNVAPRQWVAESFYADNPDRYDFLVVFSNFDWDAGPGVRGLYWSVANDVEGIGVSTFDLSDEFGSERMQGYIDGTYLADYVRPNGSLDEDRVEEILNHELGHRWLVHPLFDDGGASSMALLGRDQAHWSYLLDTDASYMYGSDWTDNGDGSFTATAIRQRFSPLDLYLMGFTGSSDVPPSTLLINPDVDVEQLPMLGATIDATTTTVTVDQVIDATGPRIPDAGNSQHEFRLAVIFLTDPGAPYFIDDVERLEDLRSFWQRSFFRESRGRGIIDVADQGDLPPGTVNIDLQAAIDWLVGQIGPSTLWLDSGITPARDTAEAIEALAKAGGQSVAVEDALSALPDAGAPSAELRYRRLEVLARYGSPDAGALADEARAEVTPEGGWPAFARYTPDAVTTARAVRAMAAAGRPQAAADGWAWLESTQNADGGWSWQGGPSSVPVTLEVLLAARVSMPADFWTLPAVEAGYAWLLDRRMDGGLGDVYPNVAQTALFLQLILDQPINQGIVQQAIDFLTANQQDEGSWESSIYKTALAINALIAFALPDPLVDPGEVFVDPENPFDDEEATLTAAVRNGGLLLPEGTPYVWRISVADQEMPLYEIPGTLPLIADTGFVTVVDTLPVVLDPGYYDVTFVIDPRLEISERTRDNNSVTIPMRVRSHPPGIDLTFSTGDLAATPEAISAMPQMVTMSGMVRNQGLTDATGAVIAIYDGDPATGPLLGSTTVDVAALGMAPFSVPVTLTEARPHVLTAKADPDALLDESDRLNNTVSRTVLVDLVTDLEIEPGAFTANPGAVDVGDPMTLEAIVHNGGTTTVSDFQVAFSYETGTPPTTFLIELQNIPDAIGPNESLTVQTTWAPNVAGSPLTLFAEVDPTGSIGDVEPGDNLATIGVTVGASPLTNLRVTPESIAFDPDPPLQGQITHVSAQITNPTDNDAGAFDAELWLDAAGTGTLLASESFAGLAAGTSVEIAADWNVLQPENRLVYVVVDPLDLVGEFVEDDNEAFVTADVQTLPDLAVSGGGVDITPDFPAVGDSVHLDVLVANQGDQGAPASVLELLDPAGAVVDSEPLPAMDGHTELALGLDWDPGASPGDHTLTVRVNPGATFPEGDDTNNQAAVAVAVQNAELFVSNQIFSPNGDGVKDTTTIFFRNDPEQVVITNGAGELVRTLDVPIGAESVVWDGDTDRGNLARDGLYDVTAGELASWAVVDNNLFAVTSELEQLLLVGFLEPEVPGFEEERSYFTSMIMNPVLEELYTVERYHRAGTSSSEDTQTLKRWSGDEFIEIGDWLPVDRRLISSNLLGDTFTAGFLNGGNHRLVRYPGPVVEPLISPDEYGFDPWISPDGRWLVWASSFRELLFVEDLDDGTLHEFDPGPLDGYRVCGYSINWSRHGVAVVSVATHDGVGYFYEVTTDDPPTVRVVEVEDWELNCDGAGGGGGASIADGPAGSSQASSVAKATGFGGLHSAFDFERDEGTWMVVGGSYSYYYGAGSTSTSAGAPKSAPFRVVWADDGTDGARSSTNQASTDPLADWRRPAVAPASRPAKASRNRPFRVVWANGGGSTPGAGRELGSVRKSVEGDSLGEFQVDGKGGGYDDYGSTLHVQSFGTEDGAGLADVMLDIGGDPFGPTPTASLSNDGSVASFQVSSYGGGYFDVAIDNLAEPGPGESAAPIFERGGGFLSVDPPGGAPPTPSDKAVVVGASPVGQFLTKWATQELRGLPLALDQALWSPVDKYVVASLATGNLLDNIITFFTPAANLTVRVKPRILFADAGVDLAVLATDRYLQSYQLEYLDLDDPAGVYMPIGLPSNEPIYGDRWGTWIPPGNGRYRVRITGLDRAGNVREHSKRVTWNGDTDIANLYTENRYISPRSSPGVKDALIWHYTVLRPANLDFAITDLDGNVVLEVPVSADQVGPMSNTWEGVDGGGNPVPDGDYLLTYGNASWPVRVDNTPPQVTLSIDDTKQVTTESSDNEPPRYDLLVNEVFAAVRDDNIESWQYQELGTLEDGVWATRSIGSETFERDGDVAWRVLGSSQTQRQRRMVALDLAGNETITLASHRDERLLFADSEPGCRGQQPPCIFPDRPVLETIIDSGGLFATPTYTLNPSYDTLVVQSTVWTDDLDLELEYRTVGLSGLPSGPWTTGSIQLKEAPTVRGVCTNEVSPAVERCYFVGDRVQMLYWDHPELPMILYEVRLKATNEDGQEILSEVALFQPEVPLAIEYLGVDHEGDRFRVTNVSDTLVSQLLLAVREVLPGGAVVWQSRGSVINRLEPGAFVDVTTGCNLMLDGDKQIRAQGIGSLGEEAVSLPVIIPPREGFSALRGTFTPASCEEGSAARGYFGDPQRSPCFPPPPWPSVWRSTGAGSVVMGGFPVDPTGIAVERYEILVDGVPYITVDGPLDAGGYTEDLDLSHLAEGPHTVSERYTYAGEEGLLGQCPQGFPLIIDRTPPTVAITEPIDGAFICPEDLIMDVSLDASDDLLLKHRVLLDGSPLIGPNEACAPYVSPGESFEVEATGLPTGVHELSAVVTDEAGNTTCSAPILIQVPDLPRANVLATPPVFSPVNTLDRPDAGEVSFTTGTPGTFELAITDASGGVVQFQVGSVTDAEQEFLYLWDGTDAGGTLQPDGVYQIELTAISPCGARDSDTDDIELDTTPPEVMLTAPEPDVLVGSSLEVKGLVRDLHFQLWQIQIFSLDSGTDWVTVDTGTSPTTETDQSIGVWNTGSAAPGDYLVRVRAVDRPGNESFSTEIPVTVRERRFIRFFQRDPEIFSPNTDGNLDETEILYELIQDALVTLLVVDEAGDVVATLIDNQLDAAVVGGTTLPWNGVADIGGVAPDGVYELVLQAADPLVPPTLESEEERLSVTIDTVPPALEMINPVEFSLNGLPLQVVGSHDELHPEEWTLDLLLDEPLLLTTGSNVFDNRVLEVLDDLEDGPYQLRFAAVDKAANPAQITRVFEIDNTAPAVQIFSPAAASVLNTLDDYVALDGEIIEENLLGYAWSYAPGTAPDEADFVLLDEATGTLGDGSVSYQWDASGLDDGPYTVRLQATDEPGRTTEARRVFTVDNTPPEIILTQPTGGAVVAGEVDVLGSVDDANMQLWSLELTPAGGSRLVPPLAVGASPVSGTIAAWTALPADGSYTLSVEAEDRAGNTADLEIMVEVQVTPPGPPVLISAEADQRDVTLVWEPGAGPPPTGYNVYRDGTQINLLPVSGTTTVDPGLADGVYTYTVRALAANGTESPDSGSLSVEIDLAGPVAHISAPADGSRISDLVQITGTAYRETGLASWLLTVREAPAGIWIPLGSGTAPVLSDFLAVWDTALAQWPDGPYELLLSATDVFGNTASAQVAVEVDNEPPVAPVLTVAFASAQDADAEINDVHVEWTLTPQPPDLAGYYLYRNGLLANSPGPVIGSPEPFLIGATDYDDKDLPDGTYIYYVTAADTAQNESAASNESDPIVIDTRRPHAVIVDPPDGSSFEQMVQLTAETPDLDVVSVQFEVMADGAGTWSPLGAALSQPPWVVELAPGSPGLYHVRAIASDAVGPDPAPESISLTETDLAPGSPSLDLLVDGGTVHLTWSPVADTTGDLDGYVVYRAGSPITGTLPSDQLEYDDSGLADGGYNYSVTAIDTAGNESVGSPSRFARVATPTFDFIDPVTEVATVALSGESDPYFDSIELQRLNGTRGWETVALFASATFELSFPAQLLEDGFNTFRFLGADAQDNRSKLSRELVIVRSERPLPPADLDATVAGADVTLDWQPSADPDHHAFTVARDGTTLNVTTQGFPYQPGTHGLLGSQDDLTAWEMAVDGGDFTGWQLVGFQASGVEWEWTWPGAELVSQVTVRWGTRARRYSVEVLVDGHWLWWHFQSSNFSTVRTHGIDAEISGIRLVIPPGSWCFNCSLNEVTLQTETRAASPPYVDAGRPDGAYEYEVDELNRFGQFSDPSELAVVVGAGTPLPPVTLQAQSAGCGEIEVSWLAPAPPPAIPLGYRLYRAASPAGPDSAADVPLIELPPGATLYVDGGLPTGAAFNYLMTTLAQVAGITIESAPSNLASATSECTSPPAPVLNEPTVAGVPIDWPSLFADVGGRGYPGSIITLLHDGAPVGSTLLDATLPDGATELPGYRTNGTLLRLSPDGRFASYMTYNGDSYVAVVGLDTGTRSLSGGFSPSQPSVSPTGDRVVYRGFDGGSHLYVLDLASGLSEQLTDDADSDQDPVFSPDGHKIAYVVDGADTVLRVIDAAGGTPEDVYTSFSYMFGPAWSPDGRYLAVVTGQGPRVIDTLTGEVHDIPYSAYHEMTGQPFSPDSGRLIWAEYPTFGAEDAVLKVYDLETRETQDFSPAPGEYAGAFLDRDTVVFLAIDPSGEVLLRSRSLADGAEVTLADNFSRDALPNGDFASWDLIVPGDGSIRVPQDDRLVKLVRPSGAFTFPDVTLHAGVNELVAEQELGDDVQSSLPIEVNVAPDLFPDAAVTAFTATPGFPLTGDPVVIEGTARNLGQGALTGCLATLVRTSPAGVSETVLVETLDLAAGESTRVRTTWNTAGQSGDYFWRLTLDATGEIPELDEDNNTGTLVVPLRDTFGVEATVETDRDSYFLGEVATLLVTVTTNDAPQDTQVTTLIEAADGSQVTIVDQRTLPAFGFDSVEMAFAWPADGIYPGDYRARVEVSRGSAPAAEDTAPFAVTARTEAEAEGSADRPAYVRGATANFLARVRNIGDLTLFDATVTLTVVPAPAGVPVATEVRQVAALTVDDLRSFNWAWDTGEAQPGAYTFNVAVSDSMGDPLAASVPYPFVIESVGAAVTGTLSLVPAFVEPLSPIDVTATLNNQGDEALVDMPVFVDVVDPQAGVAHTRLEATVSLGVGETTDVSWDYAPDMTQLRAFVGILGATIDRAPEDVQLATASFTLVDLTPPVIELLDPSGALVCDDELPIRARVTDALSGVVSVFYQLDGGALNLPMILESVEDTVYASRLLLGPSDPGSHHIEVSAADAAGNVSAPVAVDVDTVSDDGAAPRIELAGPDEGACTGPTAITFTVTDSQLSTVTATLDGAPYVSGDPITTEGAHVFELVAEDVCGRVSTVTRSFVIDTVLPVITVTDLEDGQVYAGEVTFSWGAADDNLQAVTATLDGAAVTSPFTVTDVGLHTFVVSADDCAGNLAESTFGFEVVPDEVTMAGGLFLVPPTVEPPNTVQVLATARNDSPSALTDVTVSVRLTHPVTGAVAAEAQAVFDLAAGEQVPFEPTLATAGLELLTYPASLVATGESGGAQYVLELATATLDVVDLTPPTVSVLGPGAGTVCNPVTVRTAASDALSGVEQVRLAVDGGPPMTMNPAIEPGEYLLTLDFSGDLGSHSLVATAIDGFDNEAAAPALVIDVETCGGTLDLTGMIFLDDDMVALGSPLHVESEARNNDDIEVIEALDLTLALVDPEDNSVLDSVTGSFSNVAAGQTVAVNAPFATDELGDRTYRIELRASGMYRGNAFDLLLDSVDFQVIPTVEIPTLGPWPMIVLALLLALAGCARLLSQTNSRAVLANSRVKEQRMEGARPRRRGKRRGLWLGISLLVIWGHAASPVAAEEACERHFPLLRALLEAAPVDGAELGPIPTKHAVDLGRELAIEKALWLDEQSRQRERLEQSREPGVGAALVRLGTVDAEVRSKLLSVESALEAGQAPPLAAAKALAACKAEEVQPSSAPISVRLAPVRGEAMEPRRPRRSEQPPEGYTGPPSEALRAAAGQTVLAADDEAAIAAEIAAELAGETVIPKAVIDRPDPVADRVTELGGDPLALYAHVLNEIRPASYFGAAKGPAAVLRSGEGNDFDQAGLLAEMMRLAGFPARVAWGVRAIPTGSLLEHFGVASFVELERVLTAAGIPWEPVLVGGQPGAYELERAWCEVWLPYANFRGVVLDDTGETWLSLDPELKSMATASGDSLLEQMGLNASAFVDSYLAGASCTAPLTDATSCPLPSEVLAGQVDAFLAPDGDYQSASLPRALVVQEEGVLPAGLVGRVTAVNGFDIDFSEEVSHRVRLVVREGLRELLDVTLPASDLAGNEAVLWFGPATPDDEAVVATYGDLWVAPPYLVNARVELMANGEMIAASEEGIGMGRAFELEVTLTTPGGDSLSFVNEQLTGVPVGIGIAPGSQGYATQAGGEPQSTLEVLSSLTGDYLDAAADFARELAMLDGLAVVHPFPSIAMVSSVVEPEGSLGLVERLRWQGIAIDADVFGPRAIGDSGAARRWLELAQLEASALERRIFEDYDIAAVSADKALILAADAGTAVLDVDQANLGTILPTLPFPAAVLDEIEGWVLAGGTARVPAATLDYIEWSGIGYRLHDPATGEARYQLSGNLSGGMIAVPPIDVILDLAEQLEFPSSTRTNTNPDEAVEIVAFSGNVQIGTAGKALTETDGAKLLVLVTDADGLKVQGAEVTFSILAGGGDFDGSSTKTVTTTRRGFASVDLTLGTSTAESPYYLLFQGDDYFFRAGLNLVTAEVNGYGLTNNFFEFGMPDEINDLQAPNGTNYSGFPHLSLSRALRAVPVDQHGNPISNQEVTYTLVGGASSEPEKGPELLTREEKRSCRAGLVLAEDCDGQGSITTEGGINGTWVHLVVGEDSSYQVDANAMSEDRDASTTFNASVNLFFVPGGVFVGHPLLLVSGRGQPVGNTGSESIEVYAPGETETVPIQVALYIVREDFSVVSCDDRFCTNPLGTYTTRRFTGDAAPSCLPESCGGGTIGESATVMFDGDAGSSSVSSPDGDGFFTYAVTMPSSPGRYEVVATPSIEVSVPKQPDEPDFINEVVTCGDDCGAEMDLFEIEPSPSWELTYVLWAVEGRLTEDPPPAVKLGHRNRHETELGFGYQIEPSDYPALNTVMFFWENSSLALFAESAGLGTGTAILPTGQIFQQPEGMHEVSVSVNAGWSWTPGPSGPVTLRVESERVPFSVVMFDVDIDSNNNNGLDPPERNDAEENLEEPEPDSEELGKLLFVNHNDDDRDGVPDYADSRVVNERSLVPVVIELRPEGGMYDAAMLTFTYDGPAASALPPENAASGTTNLLSTIQTKKYYDLSQYKQNAMRLWHLNSVNDERNAAAYVDPNMPHTAMSLGFSSNEQEQTFYIEALDGTGAGEEPQPFDLTVNISFMGEDLADEKVRFTPLAPDLGFNNSNDISTLRAGVSDSKFIINDQDELVEDQGFGFNFWRTARAGLHGENIVDVAPFIVDVPEILLDEEWEFFMELRGGTSILGVMPAIATGESDRLGYMEDDEEMDDQIDEFDNRTFLLNGHAAKTIELEDEHTEMAFIALDGVVGLQPTFNTLTLLAEAKDTGKRMVLDSSRVSIRDPEGFWTLYATLSDATVPLVYPIEEFDGTMNTTSIKRYPNATFQSTKSVPPDLDKTQMFIMVHGFKVAPEDALDWGNTGLKRTYWMGYRGGFALFNWEGNEAVPNYADNVENAFQTSVAFTSFLRDKVIESQGPANGWGFLPENVTVMAHSLGNQVVLDGFRYHRTGSTSKLADVFISVEPAIWRETMLPQQLFTFCLGGATSTCVPTSYSVRDLKCGSHAFWFNQSGHPSLDAVNRAYHLYNPEDDALELMRYDDFLLRNHHSNGKPHFNRTRCGATSDNYRVPIPTDDGGGLDLARSIPVFLMDNRNHEFYPYWHLALPLGSGEHPHPQSIRNQENASWLGWRTHKHSDLKDLPLPKVWPWWNWLRVSRAWKLDVE
ncbi:MAG: hypothetical protein GY719_35635 [bacterium]|nr:hypothetical protein [bacterium]